LSRGRRNSHRRAAILGGDDKSSSAIICEVLHRLHEENFREAVKALSKSIEIAKVISEMGH
jgi:hypothetical protein